MVILPKAVLVQNLKFIKNPKVKKKKSLVSSLKVSFFLLSLILSMALISGFTFDNTKVYTKTTNEKYGTLAIKNAYGFGDTLAEYKLLENTDECLIDCYAIGTIKLNVNGFIYSAIEFNDKKGLSKSINSKTYIEDTRLEDYNVQDCKLELEKETKNNSYKEVCTPKYEKREVKYWKLYNGEELEIGTYKWKIEAKKKPLENIDWIITTGGSEIGEYKLNEWAWWNTNWIAKKPLIITENSGRTLYEYTLQVNLTWFSGIKTDFGDIRFLNNDETTELNYWLEPKSLVDSKSATFWVRVPNITASDNTTIYMYYGNAGVSTTGTNISKAFLIGDTFDSATLDTTLWSSSSGTWSQSGDGYLNSSSGNGVIVYKFTGINYTGNGIIDFSASGNNGGQFWRGITIKSSSDSTYYLAGSGYANAKIFLSKDFGSDRVESGSSADFTTGTQNRFRLKFNGTLATSMNYTFLGTAGDTISILKDDASYRTGVFGLLSYDNTAYDWYGLRNWSSKEPKVSYGIEEIISLPPKISLNNPINYYNTTNPRVNISCTGTDATAVLNVTLYIDGKVNYTIYNTTANENLTLTILQGFPDGSYNWTCKALDNDLNIGQNETRYFTVHTGVPLIKITNPLNTTYLDNIASSYKNFTINWTFTEPFVDKCILFNGTHNKSINCLALNSSIRIPYGSYCFNIWVNDTFGFYNSSNVCASFDYNIRINSINYNPITYEGMTENFILNISVGSNNSFYYSYFNYNGTRYNADVVTDAGGNYILSKSISIPSITQEVNNTFLFEIVLDSATINSTTYTQQIKNISLGNCSTYKNNIYNFTMYNQIDKLLLNGTAENTTIEVDFTLMSLDKLYTIATFSQKFSQENPASICLDKNLTGNNLRVDAQIRFYSNGRVTQFYNIQNQTINNATATQSIELYNLVNTSSTNFLITYKDNNFNPVENALIVIQRKYVSDGIYKIVEIPLTDISGQAIGHFDLNSVIYSIYVTKENKLLATFNNVVVSCDNEFLGDCKLNLNPTISNTFFDNAKVIDNLYYTIVFNQTTRTIRVDYLKTDNKISTILLNAFKFDKNFNTSVCSETSTGQSGVLVCSIASSFGNSTIQAYLYKDGTLVTTEIFKINPNLDDNFGVDRIFFMILLLILLPVMFISSLVGMLIALILGLILSLLLFTYNSSSLIGKSSALVWIVIALGILAYRINRRSRE